MQLEPNDTTFANPLHLKATTIVFVGIVVMQIANIFACRSEKFSAFKIGFFNNKLILWGIIFELIFTATLIYTPFFQRIFNTIGLGWQDWGILFVFMVVIFFIEELRKKLWPLQKKLDKRGLHVILEMTIKSKRQRSPKVIWGFFFLRTKMPFLKQ
jgi:magnesium-transporting ATPase (P-type)